MVAEIKSEDKKDVVDKIIKYEQGNMTNEETIKFFQELIDSGMAWKLQGWFGRQAMFLIEQGLCRKRVVH